MADKAECLTCGVYLSRIARGEPCPNCPPEPPKPATEEQILDWIEYYDDELNDFHGGMLKELLASRAIIREVKALAEELAESNDRGWLSNVGDELKHILKGDQEGGPKHLLKGV